MAKLIDLTGQRFGMLSVVKRADKHYGVAWKCACDCGNSVIASSANLKKREYPQVSCGCLKRSRAKVNNVEDNSMPITETGCVIWLGLVTSGGYGRVAVNREYVLAHRYFYEKRFGKIPDGLCACHKCDTPSCINPDHIFLGTAKDNAEDKVRKNRHAYGERSGSAKLNYIAVKVIRYYLSKGISQQKLARLYKIGQPQIRSIECGKNWACSEAQI